MSWNPHFVRDEEVNKRKPREGQPGCVKGMKGKEYIEMLRVLGLTTLKKRRIRDDLIETYKVLSGKENVNRETFFQLIDRL